IAMVALIGISRWQDAHTPTIKAQLDRQADEMAKFLAAPYQPQDVGKQAMPLAPTTSAPANYMLKCAVCHGEAGQGQIGPSLHKIGGKPRRTRDDIIKLTKNPGAYGINRVMPAFPELSESERGEIADWILTLK